MLFVVIELQLMVPRKYFFIKKISLKNVLYVGEIYICKIQYLTILIDKYFTIKYCIFIYFIYFKNHVGYPISFNSITTLKVVIF